MDLKIFENSFLKNGILEFWSEAPIVSILTHSSNDNYVNNLYDFYENLYYELSRKITKISVKFWL